MSDAPPSGGSRTTRSAPAPKGRRLQPRHGVWLLLLAVVAVCIVVLYQKSTTNATNLDGGAIERLIPTPDSKVLQQETIGIDLAPGYEGTLALNGTPIPDDQLVVVPQLNQVTFTPGPGKVYEVLPAQQNCLVATFWLSAEGPGRPNTRSWCFTVL